MNLITSKNIEIKIISNKFHNWMKQMLYFNDSLQYLNALEISLLYYSQCDSCHTVWSVQNRSIEAIEAQVIWLVQYCTRLRRIWIRRNVITEIAFGKFSVSNSIQATNMAHLFRSTNFLAPTILRRAQSVPAALYHKNVSEERSMILYKNAIFTLWLKLFFRCWTIMRTQEMLDQWTNRIKMLALVWLEHQHVVMSWNYRSKSMTMAKLSMQNSKHLAVVQPLHPVHWLQSGSKEKPSTKPENWRTRISPKSFAYHQSNYIVRVSRKFNSIRINRTQFESSIFNVNLFSRYSVGRRCDQSSSCRLQNQTEWSQILISFETYKIFNKKNYLVYSLNEWVNECHWWLWFIWINVESKLFVIVWLRYIFWEWVIKNEGSPLLEGSWTKHPKDIFISPKYSNFRYSFLKWKIPEFWGPITANTFLIYI